MAVRRRLAGALATPIATTVSTVRPISATATATATSRASRRQFCASPRSNTQPARPAPPAKTIPDYLVPLPSRQLSTLLDDMLPSTRRDRQQQPLTLDADAVLPPGGHLAYFPPLAPASDLAPDGAEADHLPRGFPAAELREDGGGARRLWAGGELVFRDGWHTRLRMDGRAWTCEEEVRAREGKEGVVDVVRRYGLPGKWDVQETRSLAFIRHVPGQRTIKARHAATATHELRSTLTHLFQFSALSYNAHFIHLRQGALVHGPLLLAAMLRGLECEATAAAAAGAQAGSETAASANAGTQTEGAAAAAGELGSRPMIESLSYRNLAPLVVGHKARVCVRRGEGAWDVWVEGEEGGMVARGRATMAV